MTTAGSVAIELRRIADAFDKNPEAEIRTPTLYFHYWDEKAAFIETVALMPRPLKKSTTAGDYARLRIEHEVPSLHLDVTILQSKICELLEPAKPAVYNCVPLLSLEEEASLAGGNDAQ